MTFFRLSRSLGTILFTVATAAVALQAVAQTGGDTPRSCLAAVTAYERDQMSRRTQTGATYAQIIAEKRKKARECVASFVTHPQQDAELPAFARLQLLAGDTSAAVTIVQTYLATANSAESAHAERYTIAIPLLISSRSAASFKKAEQLATQLDSMSAAVTATKVAAHGALLSYYRAIDVDEKIDRHAGRIIEFIPSLEPAQLLQHMKVVVLAYTSLAEVYGNRAQASEAVSLLTRGISALADLPGAEAQLKAVRERYALVGTKGAPITATHWLNAPPGTTTYTPHGNATLLEFSAHWCGPCLLSYPAITRLQNKYAPQGLRTVFATTLYGFFRDRENLSAQQEIDADQEYFVKEHALPVQVAIAANEETDQGDPNSRNYKVAGIPHIVVLDKAGIIQMIVIGWDPASEARLDAMIAGLLAPKAGIQ